MLYFTDSFNTSMLSGMHTMTLRSLDTNFSEIVKELKNMNFSFKVQKIQEYFSKLFNTDCSNTSDDWPSFNKGDIVYVCQPIDKLGRTTPNTYSQRLDVEAVVNDNEDDLEFRFFRVTVF